LRSGAEIGGWEIKADVPSGSSMLTISFFTLCRIAVASTGCGKTPTVGGLAF
jgi:hypothetical protein